MAPVKIDTQACITVDEVATAISRYSGSPTDQKTRAYSPVSPARGTSRDKPPSSRSSGFRSPSPEQLVHGMTHRYPSHQSSASASASGTATAGSSSSRGGTGEDTLTLRRREANRLAAQRFRSRKKGYQDSLEEKIRILEEEKDSMARRLDPNHRRSPPEYNRHDPYRRRSVSPDRHIDADVRVASLESANRRLQDELRGVVEENERLRDEVDRWRRWELEMRDQRSTEDRYMRGMPSLPPLEAKAMAPPSYPPTSPYDSSYAAHAPRHPPLERGQSWAAASPHRLPSPGPRLPPLRLAPAGSAPAVETSRPLLPRPESMERLSHSGGLPRSLP